jgi:hypothetical protein
MLENGVADNEIDGAVLDDEGAVGLQCRKQGPITIAAGGDEVQIDVDAEDVLGAEVAQEAAGDAPADFDRRIEISGESGGAKEIDENMLLEAMPDFIPFLPRE